MFCNANIERYNYCVYASIYTYSSIHKCGSHQGLHIHLICFWLLSWLAIWLLSFSFFNNQVFKLWECKSCFENWAICLNARDGIQSVNPKWNDRTISKHSSEFQSYLFQSSILHVQIVCRKSAFTCAHIQVLFNVLFCIHFLVKLIRNVLQEEKTVLFTVFYYYFFL